VLVSVLPLRVHWCQNRVAMTKSSIEAGAADNLELPTRAVPYGALALAFVLRLSEGGRLDRERNQRALR
jgi:hypothetical protein